MRSRMSYAQQLRVVGQTVETLQLRDFQVTTDRSGYVVEAAPPAETPPEYLTPQDLDRLERAGQAKRKDSSQMPDFYRPSQVLRALGAYLDIGGLQLLQLSKHGPGITLEAQTATGGKQTEERSIAAVYDMSVRMYLKRSSRE